MWPLNVEAAFVREEALLEQYGTPAQSYNFLTGD